jgi:hypothetical protein
MKNDPNTPNITLLVKHSIKDLWCHVTSGSYLGFGVIFIILDFCGCSKIDDFDLNIIQFVPDLGFDQSIVLFNLVKKNHVLELEISVNDHLFMHISDST